MSYLQTESQEVITEDEELESEKVFILSYDDVCSLYKYLQTEFISPEFHQPVIDLVKQFRNFI